MHKIRLMAEVILKITSELMIYSPMQIFSGEYKNIIFENGEKLFGKLVKDQEYHLYIGLFQKIWNLMKILRVSRSETMLTVYRALYILKHSGWAKGCFCQQPSILLPRKEYKIFQSVSRISQTF